MGGAGVVRFSPSRVRVGGGASVARFSTWWVTVRGEAGVARDSLLRGLLGVGLVLICSLSQCVV